MFFLYDHTYKKDRVISLNIIKYYYNKYYLILLLIIKYYCTGKKVLILSCVFKNTADSLLVPFTFSFIIYKAPHLKKKETEKERLIDQYYRSPFFDKTFQPNIAPYN